MSSHNPFVSLCFAGMVGESVRNEKFHCPRILCLAFLPRLFLGLATAGAISPYIGVAGIGLGGMIAYSGQVSNPIFYLILLAGGYGTYTNANEEVVQKCT